MMLGSKGILTLISIAILVNNAFKTVQQSAKDKEDICRRADARQRYLTQDFTLWWAGLRCIILEDCYKYSKKRPGLVCPGRKCFRGTTCIQSLALHFVSTDILCSCNVELTLKPTWHVRSGLVDQTGYAVWFTARGLLPQFVHKSSHRPLSLCASRGCVLLPVMAFGWYRDIHCPNRVDKCFLGLHYTFIERKLSTGFWIIAVKFMFLNEFWLRYWERSEQ